MTVASLDRLIAREEALVAALDAFDVTELEQASIDLRDAIAEVTASGAWHAGPEVGGRVIQALRLAEAAGGRINHLADRNRRQLDRLATLTGAPLPQAYRRNGRLS